MCDQVVVLLSPEYSRSVVWHHKDSDTDSVDLGGDTDGVGPFVSEVTETNEQENTMPYPGFQVPIPFVVRISVPDSSKMHSRHISHNIIPQDCPVDPAALVPRLLPGETAQGLLTVVFIPRQIYTEEFCRRSFNTMSLKNLL